MKIFYFFYLMTKKESALRNRIIEFVIRKGLSIREFERTAGLSNGSVGKFTDNTGRDSLVKIQEVFSDFDPDYILSGRMGVGENSYTSEGSDFFLEKLFEERKMHDQKELELIKQNSKLIEIIAKSNYR